MKILYFLLFMLFINSQAVADEIESNEMPESQIQDNLNFGLTEKDFIIENKEFFANDLKFNLKISIPSGWDLDSNEEQGIGKPMEIKLKDETNENLIVEFPKGGEHKLALEDKEFINHVYNNEVSIPITIKNFGENQKTLLVSYLICGNVGNCIPGEQEIVITK